MVSRIRVLDDQTINKIAAGEVIENPASVIKELVENAIDAQSTEIVIEIKGGGRQLIRVSDNGCGMNADDAVLCLERHATSKIRSVEQIHEIHTMGFRGEALPSIAAISKFTLLTCPVDAPPGSQGTMVLVDGGRILQCCPAACVPGTTIEVKNLFFNVPVRKKFLKSPAYDANEILKMVTSLALAHPTIQFQLINNQETAISTMSSDGLKGRILDCLGKEFADSLCPLEIANGEYQLSGFIGNPSSTRPNRTGQYLFINNRPVYSLFFSKAMREGYGTTLSPNRHPVFVLHLKLPGEAVDVNVHPQKREVRLRHEYLLRQLIIQGVEASLQATGASLFDPNPLPVQEFSEEAPFSAVHYADVFLPEKTNYFAMRVEEEPFVYTPAPASVPVMSPVKPPESLPFPEFIQTKTEGTRNKPRVLATLSGYIVLDANSLPSAWNEGQEGLCLVDQKAAHSRILYEQCLKTLEKGQQMDVQALLIPETFETSPAEAALFREHLALLQDLGIHLKEFGQNTFAVDALALIYEKMNLKDMLAEFVRQIDEASIRSLVGFERQKQIAKTASRTAIPRTKKMDVLEAQGLVTQLFQCDSPRKCPYGQPTFVNLGQTQLAALFAQRGR